jgi:hypothetical protein
MNSRRSVVRAREREREAKRIELRDENVKIIHLFDIKTLLKVFFSRKVLTLVFTRVDGMKE